LCFNIKYPKCPKGGGRRVFSNEQLFSQNPQNLKKRRLLYMTLKRGLAFVTIIAIIGVAGCTTTAPSILSFMGLPATMNVGDTATLTATGNPGSTQGLWDWVFTVSPAGCGSVSPASFPPGTLTTVTTTFTAGSVGGSCTVTVTIKTAAGRSASASQTTTIISLLPLRGWFYVKDGTFPTDSIIGLNGTFTTNFCSGFVGDECDDDDGASYTNFPPTGGGSGLNSVIAGHPLASGTNTLQVIRYGGGDIGPHDLYIHITGGAGTEFNESEPNDSISTATPIPPLPTCSVAYSAAPGANPQKPGTPYTETLPGGAAPGNWVAHGLISPPPPAPPDLDYYGPITVTTPTTIVVWVDGTPDTVGGPHDHDFPPDALDGVISLHDPSGNNVLGIPSTPAAAEGGKPADSPERIASNAIDGGFNTDSANAEAFSIQVGPGTYYILVRGYGSETHAYDMTACKFP
jgi:hypothetical protein